jgi:ArsR family transcriptional regulator, arsenate/arsenite/antimonite-responsive transcriptional repressor
MATSTTKASTVKSTASKAAKAAPAPRPSPEIRRVADLLKQVSDPTRLQVLMLLNEKERNVSELCADLGTQSQPAVSHHLALLRVSGLIESRREGKHNFYSVRTDHFGELLVNLFSATGEMPKKVRFHDFMLTYSGQ